MAISANEALKKGVENMHREYDAHVEYAERKIDDHLRKNGCDPRKMVVKVDLDDICREAQKEIIRRYKREGWKVKFKWRSDGAMGVEWKIRYVRLKVR